MRPASASWRLSTQPALAMIPARTAEREFHMGYMKAPRGQTAAEATAAICTVERAVEHLRAARDLLREAKAPKALQRVRSALSSAEGAVRNAGYRVSRAARQAPNSH